MACALRSSKNINGNNTDKQLQSGACELDFQHLTDKDIADAAMEQEEEEQGEEDGSEEEMESTECIMHSVALQ